MATSYATELADDIVSFMPFYQLNKIEFESGEVYVDFEISKNLKRDLSNVDLERNVTQKSLSKQKNGSHTIKKYSKKGKSNKKNKMPIVKSINLNQIGFVEDDQNTSQKKSKNRKSRKMNKTTSLNNLAVLNNNMKRGSRNSLSKTPNSRIKDSSAVKKKQNKKNSQIALITPKKENETEFSSDNR